jgi:hypothetical protein
MRSRQIFELVPPALLAAALLLPAAPAKAGMAGMAAIAGPTAVTAGDSGKIRAAGTLNVEGRCRILTDDQGNQYALVGNLGSFTTGDRISVTGTRGAPSSCIEGTTIRVESARPDLPRGASLQPSQRRAGIPDLPALAENPETAAPRLAGFSGFAGGPAPLERVRKGSITVRGKLTGEGVECQALRGSDGRLYTLTGNLHGLAVGDKVRVTGSVAEVSTCQQGTTLVVEQIRLADSQGDEPEARMKREVLTLTGSLTGEGVECQAFRSEKGEIYTLTGDLKGFKTGDRVSLTASLVEGGPCQEQGKTLQVKTIRRVK